MTWYMRRGNKYHAETTMYNGIQYHSKKERNYAFELDLLKKAGEIKSWERQVPISLEAYGSHICDYMVDFIVHHNDELTEYVEVKGFMTEVFRLKWKMFEAKMRNEENVKLTMIR